VTYTIAPATIASIEDEHNQDAWHRANSEVLAMKAAVMQDVQALLVLEDVHPMIGPHEALETRTSGICGTDLHILAGLGYVPNLPHILGHEPSGVIKKWVGGDPSSSVIG
jgi:NADPH:quinone reductase-like Zn-dependent oxidoreductase